MRAARPLAVLLVALLLAPAAAGAQGEPAELTEATLVEREGAVEVWVRLSRPVRYQSELIDTPHRLVLDFEDTTYRWATQPLPVSAEPVRQIRGSQFRKGVARLVIELRRKATYTIDADREGLRIVIPRDEAASAGRSPAAAAAPPSGSRSVAAPVVYGVIRLDERPHAYIFDPATRQVRRYAEGDALGDAVVEKIGERAVVLRTPGGRVELPVSRATPDGAPRSPDSPSGRVRPAPAPVGREPRS